MWEASRDRAKVDGLLCSRVEDGMVGGCVLHGGVIDRVAQLPPGDVLHVVRAGHCRHCQCGVGEIRHLHLHSERLSGQAQAAGANVKGALVGAADHRIQTIAGRIA